MSLLHIYPAKIKIAMVSECKINKVTLTLPSNMVAMVTVSMSCTYPK